MNDSQSPHYILHCLFGPQVAQFHRNVVNEIAETTGLRLTQTQGLSAHFTLKYQFAAATISDVEQTLEAYCAARRAAPVTIEGVGSFGRSTVFFDVHLSPQAKEFFSGLNSTLHQFRWMKWDEFDGENLHFHMTVAEQCGDQFESALAIATRRARRFDAWLDNLTILREVEVRNGIGFWEIHRSLQFGDSREGT